MTLRVAKRSAASIVVSSADALEIHASEQHHLLQSDGSDHVEQLILALAKEARNRPLLAPLPLLGDGYELIIDHEVDGMRCLLLRQHEPSLNILLSPREQEIARMVAEGHTNKNIAAVLEISMWTVCTHLRRVFSKLGVGTRAAMVARLSEAGLIGHSSLPK